MPRRREGHAIASNESLKHTISHEETMIEGRDVRRSSADDAAIEPNVGGEVHPAIMARIKSFSTDATLRLHVNQLAPLSGPQVLRV
jgi:hypothetical protein